MSRMVAGVFVAAIAMLGCQTLYEELPGQPTAVAGQPGAEPTPAPTLITLPVQVVPAPTPTPSSTPPTSPTPQPQPTPEPNPQPTPAPSPQPTPTPSQSCGTVQITIDARCAGVTPDCGIASSSKNPVLRVSTSVVLDASYYINNERNKVHDYDPCYPGPIESWTQVSGGSISCGTPFSNGHVMKCGPFDSRGSFGFKACGHGACSNIAVTVR